MQKHKKRMCCKSPSCLVLASNYTTWHVETETAPMSLGSLRKKRRRRRGNS